MNRTKKKKTIAFSLACLLPLFTVACNGSGKTLKDNIKYDDVVVIYFDSPDETPTRVSVTACNPFNREIGDEFVSWILSPDPDFESSEQYFSRRIEASPHLRPEWVLFALELQQDPRFGDIFFTEEAVDISLGYQKVVVKADAVDISTKVVKLLETWDPCN